MPRRKLPPYDLPISANTPCTAVPPSTPVAASVHGTAYCLHPAYQETLPGGPSYTVLDQVENGPGDDFARSVPAGRLFLMGTTGTIAPTAASCPSPAGSGRCRPTT